MSTMTDRVGHKIGNYRLVRLLGEGGFAEVYLAEHIYLGSHAAIKLLYVRVAPEDIAQFQQEGRMLAALLHPQIVRVLDFGIEDRTPYLVMDYAPGGTLRARHPKGSQVPLPTIVEYVRQIAQALQHAHDHKFIHRDIKPENMLISREGTLLLSDFGIAVISRSERTSLNSQAGTSGTPYYMAPELFAGRPRTASDQYSLGVIVYEWLCGVLPFAEGNAIQLGFQHTYQPVPPLRQHVPMLSPAVEQVVMTALAKKPQERFGSIRAFATALEQASLQTPIHAPRSPVSPPPPQPPSDVVSVVQSRSTPPAPALSTPQGTLFVTYRGHSRIVSAVAWSPDGTRIASGSADGTVQVWNAHDGSQPFIYRGHRHDVDAVAWSPDGSRIASGSWDEVQVWQAV
jgi:eukaryotic-like serine/threonine-protein kinase